MRALILIMTIGCSSDVEKVSDGDVEDTENPIQEAASWTLHFSLESDSLTAGQSTPYSLYLQNEEGDYTEPNWELSSNVEPGFFWNLEMIRPHFAGDHLITASAELEGETYTAEANINVLPELVYDLDLVLSDQSFEAGDSVSYEVNGVDKYGNEILGIDASVVSSDEALSVEDGQLSSVTPGLYTVSAAKDGIEDVEILVVDPGEATSITLNCPDIEVELKETLACEVSVTDAYGNETDDSWSIWVDGPGQTTVSWQNITFLDEGSYTINVEVNGTNLSDSHGPVFVDSTGPVIDIFTPERGEWNTSYYGNVEGNVEDIHSGVSSLEINSQIVTPDANGDFLVPLTYDMGVNLIESTAVDGDGNSSTDSRSVLAGSFQPKNEGIDDGMHVWIGDNATGIDEIEEYGEGLIDNQDLGAMLPPNPVYQNESETCTWFGCITWYSVNLNIGNPNLGNKSLEVDPKNNGTIVTTFTLSGASIDWWGNGKVVGINKNGNGVISADIVVTLIVTPSVSNSQINIDIDSVNTSISANFGWDDWLGDVLDFFGVTGIIEDEIEDALKNAVEDAVYDVVPGLLEDILGELSISQSFNLMNSSYEFEALPSSILVQDSGIQLGLNTDISTDNWSHADDGLGSLYSAYDAPPFYSWNGFGIGLSMDVMNQLLYQVWGGGILDMEIDDDELGLDDGDLELLFPNSTDLRLTVFPMLPPVAVPDSSGDISIQLGDMYIALHNGDYSDQDFRLEVYTMIEAPLTLSATASAINANIGDPNFVFDVVYPDANSAGAQSAETLLAELVPFILPQLTDAISEIELPDISGFNFENVFSYVTDGNLKVAGDLDLN